MRKLRDNSELFPQIVNLTQKSSSLRLNKRLHSAAALWRPHCGLVGRIKFSMDHFERRSESKFQLIELVFGNDLIGNKIASYLNLADLKDASASCHTLFEMVRNSQNFNEIAKLYLNRAHFERGQDFGTSGQENLAPFYSRTMTTVDAFLGFGVIEVDVGMFNEVLNFLQGNSNFLKNVHTVRLVMNTFEKINEAIVAMLDYVFAITSIVTLQIERKVAIYLNFADNFNTPKWIEYFTKVRNLEIISEERDEWGDFPIFQKNIKYFSTLPLKLQKLEIAKVGFDFKDYANIADLILSNAESIQDLVLDFKETCPWGTAQFGNIRLPLLKKFSTSLTDGRAEVENFIVFMKNQPFLEELSLCVLKKCDQLLLNLIQERGSKLRKLHLRAKHFDNNVNWGFLADMKHLKDFALVRPKSFDLITLSVILEGNGVTFLRSLPTSLTRLKLRGIDHFWWDVDQETEIEEFEKQSLFNRFPNLVTLSIIHYGGKAFNENFLDKVNISMPKLQRLELSNIAECIGGAIFEKVAISLANLKGLTHITLKGWGNIVELMSSISHQFLRTLSLVTGEKGLTEWDTNLAIQFLKRNPSLEKISISGNKLILRPDLVNELQAKSSRLVHVEWRKTSPFDVFTADSDSDASEYVDSDSDA